MGNRSTPGEKYGTNRHNHSILNSCLLVLSLHRVGKKEPRSEGGKGRTSRSQKPGKNGAEGVRNARKDEQKLIPQIQGGKEGFVSSSTKMEKKKWD